MKLHKKTDPAVLIPGTDIMYHGECELDSKGIPVTYEIEIWEYDDFLRRVAKYKRLTFTRKRKAEEFVRDRLLNRLVAELDVFSVRHDRIPFSRKNIYHYET